MESWSRQQLNAELAKKNSARRGPSEFGAIIPAGSEDEIQALFFKWVDLHISRFPELELWYAIPNAGFASKKQGALRKLTGRRSGVPDTHWPLPMPCSTHATHVPPSGRWNGLWIEFKRPGEHPTAGQWEWITRLRVAGHRVEVCTSWTDGANVAIDYGQLPIATL
jgi:hypothetical protein